MSVLIETSAGDIVVDLYVSRCPVAAKNFLKLCKTHYYDGVLVFNVERDFIAQTGDPTGTGNGGMSMNGLLGGAHHFKHEISSEIKHDSIGLLGMTARNNTNEPNGSQFYITLRKDIDYLDGKFTIFGKVEEDPSSTIKAINSLPTDLNGRPLMDARILRTHVLEDPFPDPDGLTQLRPPKLLRPLQIPAAETVERRLPWIDKSEESLASGHILPTREAAADKEEKKKRDADNAAKTLEILGDLPSIDAKPPETVLFVCKLHPLTDSKSLDLIFSRFGNIKSCDVVADWKTGDSLQYAFIEFEKEEDCAEAYLKMNNVKIDDRRIQVDFSQSVSKQFKYFCKSKI